MKLILNESIKDFSGKIFPDSELNKLLANFLMKEEQNIPAIKAHDWALKLWNDGFIEIEEDDRKLLEQFVNQHRNITVLVKVPLLKIIKGLE